MGIASTVRAFSREVRHTTAFRECLQKISTLFSSAYQIAKPGPGTQHRHSIRTKLSTTMVSKAIGITFPMFRTTSILGIRAITCENRGKI